jgi:DNA-binding HxlR family transcriptional regulator
MTATHEPQACNAALTRAFGFLGKRWNGVILATLGPGPLGFAELKRRVAGISDSMLSERLAELGQADLIAREVEPGPPVSVRYHLAASGTALLPALEALTTWAEDNLPAACPAD